MDLDRWEETVISTKASSAPALSRQAVSWLVISGSGPVLDKGMQPSGITHLRSPFCASRMRGTYHLQVGWKPAGTGSELRPTGAAPEIVPASRSRPSPGPPLAHRPW